MHLLSLEVSNIIDMLKENFVLYFQESIERNWEQNALSDYKGRTLTYKDVANQIVEHHILLENIGIKEGDKVALIGKNSYNWAILYLSVVTYGAVAVPLLPDFMPKDVQNLVNHSEAKLLFVSEAIYQKLDFLGMPAIYGAFSLDSYSLLDFRNEICEKAVEAKSQQMKERYPDGVKLEEFKLPVVHNDALAMISYTSGTTGNSKGVMLSHNNLAANVRFARNNMPLKSGDALVSFLPLAHSYGLAFEFLFPFSLGCHITFLTKTPSPQIITQAFAEIKPRLILSVPLVVEKIFKKKLLPIISKPTTKLLLKIPIINNILFASIRKKLKDVFGGNFHEIVIGGAPFNAEAERFFKKIKFPFTVGYGMTECGPLIGYSSWKTTKLKASGKLVDTLEIAIDSENPQENVGEILVKGDNVMLGYYKNEAATSQTIDPDGWLHTGDLGVVGVDGDIFIKGRSKTILLGASGQNIYPEEIEAIIGNKYCVVESVVIEEGGKLIALVHPDKDIIKKENLGEKELEIIMETNKVEVNKQLPQFMQLSKIRIHYDEFEKTPKQSIKRYLYTKGTFSE